LKDHPLYSGCLENVNVALDSSLQDNIREKFEKYIIYMSGTFTSSVSSDTSVLVGSAVGSLDYKVALENNIDILEPEWIQECWKEKKYVDPSRHKMKPFCGCLIAVTGLASPTRLEIKRLVETYGGLYTPDLTRSCTHLLSKEPEGLKYHYAIQWGIHCVSPEWLFDSINEQCCKDERLYLLPIVSRRPIFSPRSRGDLGRMSPKLRNNHVSQIKRQRFSNTARGQMNVVFINSDPVTNRVSNSQKKNTKISQFIKTKGRLIDGMNLPKYQSNTTITKEEVTKLIELCDETIDYYTKLAQQKDISEKLSQLQSSPDQN